VVFHGIPGISVFDSSHFKSTKKPFFDSDHTQLLQVPEPVAAEKGKFSSKFAEIRTGKYTIGGRGQKTI